MRTWTGKAWLMYGGIGGVVVSAGLAAFFACRSFAGPPLVAEKLQGVELDGLDQDALKKFYDTAAKEPSPCKAGQSLMDALRKGPTCTRAVYAGRYLVRLTQADLVPSEIEQYYEWRFLAKPVTVDTAGAPMAGAASGKITVVEFADFECPHCRMLQPEMQEVLQRFPKDVKLYFKNFPLGQHEHAQAAAIAAEAAGRQGKFWEMERKLFENQDHLEPSDIDGYAQQLGLDMTKFHADQADPAIKQAVLADRKQADDLKLEGTPAIFINGLELHGPKTADEISDWISEALGREPPPQKSKS